MPKASTQSVGTHIFPTVPHSTHLCGSTQYTQDYECLETQSPRLTQTSGRTGTYHSSPVCCLLQLVKTAELDPSRNYIAGFHPHGVLAAGAFLNLCTESTGFTTLFPGIRSYLMMLTVWFRAPFFRDYIMSGGESLYPASGTQEEAGWVGGSERGLSTALCFFQVLVQ